MAINPLIALQTQTPNIQPAVNQLVQGISQGSALKRRDVNNQLLQTQKEQSVNDRELSRFKSVYTGARQILPFLQSGDTDSARNILTQRKSALDSAGIDSRDTTEALEMLERDPKQLIRSVNNIITAGDKIFPATNTDPASVREAKFFQNLPKEGGDLTQDKFMELQRAGYTLGDQRFSPTNKVVVDAETVGKSKAEVENIVGDATAKTKAKETQAVATAERAQATIQEGLDAAKGLPILKRSLGLLNSVKTGGFQNVSLKAKQLLGVEGADEGELSANLGQAILGDLRTTFGAAFTEKEGKRLESIRANFGKNPETNKRLLGQTLQIAEDAARRAMKQAADAGDFRTAQEIQDFLNFEFKFDDGELGNKVGRFKIEVVD